MCGIAGIVDFNTPISPNHVAQVRDMLERIRHRGPDGQATTVGSHAVLGNCRLALLDLLGSNQPMVSPDGRYQLTFNGQIYNYRNLRADLAELWNFQTLGDTEVVLAALIAYGREALPRFNGMFSFFIWDNVRHKGWGARDRLGVKPFIYRQIPAGLAFASEAKALVNRVGTNKANVEGILEYLIAPYFSGVRHTMFADLHSLPPGHLITINSQQLKVENWAKPFARPNSDGLHDPESLVQELRESLVNAVDRSLMADKPVGAFLSGGLDSTALVALARPSFSDPLHTFALRFQDQDSFDYTNSLIVREDDTAYAINAAAELGTAHHLIEVDRSSLPNDLRNIAKIDDTLPAWEQEVAQHHLAKFSSSHVSAVLVGDAADETHYGYSFMLDEIATGAPEKILERFGVPELHPTWHSATKNVANAYRDFAASSGYQWGSTTDNLLATSFLIQSLWLPRLLMNGDLHTMAFSLEARVPFADTALLDIAARIPPELAIDSTQEKKVLRAALNNLMPEANRVRRKSSLPKDQRCARIYQTEARDILRTRPDFLAHWFELSTLETLASTNRTLTERERSLLFRVICLQHWQEAYNVAI